MRWPLAFLGRTIPVALLLAMALPVPATGPPPADEPEGPLRTEVHQTVVDLLQDGSFELGSPNPFWTESPPGTVIRGDGCTEHSGVLHAQMNDGLRSVSQTVTIPNTGAATLSFFMRQNFWLPLRSILGQLVVRLDSSTILTVDFIPATSTPYELYTVDVSSFADGGAHVLTFSADMWDSEFFCIDDVSLTIPAIPLSERNALITLYNRTNGPGWTHSSGWLGPWGTECSWYGVTCTGDTVTSLSLYNNQLSGTLPNDLGDLTHLLDLVMSGNSLTGVIPSTFVNLTDLQKLYLVDNQLTGAIPPELGSLLSLYDLSLSGNQLTGPIPAQLGNLGSLLWLVLDDNHLEGPIPPTLGGLGQLEELDLSGNQLTGQLPSQLGNLSALLILDVSGNQLTGPLPSSLSALVGLQHLDLSFNPLDTQIPSWIGNLVGLHSLDLEPAGLWGEIPVEMMNLTGISDCEGKKSADTRTGCPLNLCLNQLYTDDPLLNLFLRDKAGTDWANCQIPTVRFSWTPLSPLPGEPAQFTDETRGGPTGWSWTFGDGGTSTVQDPTHLWSTSGSKSVTLTASNSVGSDSASQTVSVAVGGPTAGFSFSPSEPSVGSPVQFTDASSGYLTYWSWTFGDGGTSAAQSPSHTYASSGEYQVDLTVGNTVLSDSVTHTVTVWATPTAEFSWSPTSPGVGQTVQFSDLSTDQPTSWSWDFGDGGTSTAQSPSHAFATAGDHTVTLTSTNPAGSDSVSHTVTVADSPVAAFSWSPTVPGVGQATQFTDQSTGGPSSWSWVFGDGGTSTVQNPSHAYAAAGDYEVSLTVSNVSGTDTTSHTVMVSNQPGGEFTWAPTIPGVGEATQFTDQSSGGPTAWSWGFGDGGTSTVQNPSHAFTTAGDHTVTLTVTNPAGSDTVAHTVTVSDTPSAEFTWAPTAPARGEPVQFTDLSGGSPTSWAWDFGDGDISSQQNPRHTFFETASVTVTLTVANAGGSDSVSHTLLVGSPPEAEFTWSPTEPDVGEAIQFTDESTCQPDSWTWDFGDGATSPYRNTSHVYTRAGVYDVTLTVSNVVGTDSVTHPITVGDAALELSLSWRPESPRLGEPVVFTLASSSGVPTAVSWDFGAPGCAGSPEHGACTATGSGCETWMHRFSRPGEHTVSVRAVVEEGLTGATSATLSISDTGSCDTGSWCGDGRCNAPESAIVCPADCAAVCGNLVCEVGEDPCSCAFDCQSVCGNRICEAGETWVDCGDDCVRPADFAGGGVETCRHCLLPTAVGLEPGLAGTLWRGEAMLSNLDPEAPLVFWSVFTPDSPGAKDEILTSEPAVLEPGESLYFSSFVEEVFGVSGSGNVQLMADVPLTVTTRIYNTGDEGTYGQLVDAFDASSIVCPGQLAILIGLEQDAEYRTNVFVQDVSGVGATFDLEVFGPRSQQLGALTRTVASSQTLRTPLSQVPGVSGMRGGHGTVRVTTGGRVAVIASVVDNATGDAVTVKPVVIGRMGAAKEGEAVHALVPVAARADGYEGTVWRTQLVVLNLGDTQDVRLELHPTGWATPVERTYTLGPRGMIASRDIVEQLLGDVQAQGALHVYSETPVGIDSRTRNLGSTGTYGDSLKGLRSGDLLQTGETGSLELLESSPTFRTNIGFANLADAEATVELTLYRLVGTLPVALGSRTYTVPAMRTLQVNKAFEALGAGTAQPAKATIRVLSGGPIYAYASKVDNATGDPTNTVAVPMR